MPAPALTPRAARRQVWAQLFVCLGCCCGRTDRGNPAVPTEWLKAEWKRRALRDSVHLTVSGCLGPCELVNVVMLVHPGGTLWLGGLAGIDDYEALLAWVEQAAAARTLVPLPPALAARQFERYGPARPDCGTRDAGAA
jgi:cobaltochelatase CobN